MQEGVESAGKFVVSGCDTAELLEAIEESLDEVSCLVAVPVNISLGVAIASRWDYRFCTGGLDDVNQGIAVVALVGDDGAGRDCLNQGSALRDIGNLASRQDQTNRIAECIDTCMNLGGQPAPRATNRLIATVFLGAPAACWWARTIVASMKSSSKSASPWIASATRCQTPYSSQRANRTYTECQFPHSLGKSRQGDPVRARYKTASTKRRLSAALPPLSVGLPGNNSAIRNHCASFNIRRSMCHIQIPECEHKSATVNRP
jgi:hypothetical protein